MKRPGGELSSRPLHFIWITDCSGSMSVKGKIEALNTAIRNVIPHMQDTARENPNAKVLVRAIKFSDGASWHIAEPIPVDEFTWADLSTGGLTSLGRALRLVAEQLNTSQMSDRGLPPVLVLVSDGQPTDDFKSGLNELLATPWGKKSVRIAIAIGEDADIDVLQQFIGHPELKPLVAHNAEQLVHFIKWASTAVLQSASAPSSQMIKDSNTGNVPIPKPPTDNVDVDDVW